MLLIAMSAGACGSSSHRWLQVSLAPHFYCPGVSLETRSQCFQGAGQWEGFDNTIGYLTVAPGYCSGGKCKVLHLPCAVQSPT